MKRTYTILLLLLAAAGVTPAAAQDDNGTQEINKEKKETKAWEFGLGGSVFQFNRVTFHDFTQLSNGGYQFDLDLKHAVFGGNIYVARELSKHFYIDLQGTAGFTEQMLDNQDKRKWIYSAGLGLQWRLGEYFNSKYIDPYFRAGAGYMRKEFDIIYSGTQGLTDEEMKWIMRNFGNKDGKDRKDLTPVSLGGGVNLWMNDRWGIGLQADYVLMPYKDVANSLQGTARVIYRLGGKTKKSKPIVTYVDRPIEVEKIVEVEVEKIVEIEREVKVEEKLLHNLINNVHFDFDKATLTAASEEVLDQIAAIVKENTDERFLITGFTDSRGSQPYNKNLSEQRAIAVVEALEKRGVPRNIMKARGVGHLIAIAKTSASDEVRKGDRKITIEIITNQDYWNYLNEIGIK